MTRHMLAAFLACGLSFPVFGADIGPVSFNQTEIEAKSNTVDVEKPMEIFEAVFAQMADQVMIYPTENYFYFSFFANGTKYSGNMRLHPDDREKGLVHFAYFDTADATKLQHLKLTQEEGVTLSKLSDLVYRMGYGDKNVTMRMNPLAQTDPGSPTVAQGEHFVGRGQDESGLIFTLVYNEEANTFLWVLDPEQTMPVELAPATPGLGVHVTSGFAFYQEEPEARQVLIGVNQYESVRNTWYDGPFDQLPDNWLPETKFRAFAERTIPALKGQINDRGEYLNMEARMAVMPYMHYRSLADVVDRMDACEPAGFEMPRPSVLACLFRN